MVTEKCPFGVGQTVRFRKEHQWYADRFGWPTEGLVITRIEYRDSIDWFVRMDIPGRNIACYAKRLEATGGPW